MFPRHSASRASRTCSRDLLRTTVHHHTQVNTQPFYGGAKSLTLQRRGNSTKCLTPASVLNSPIHGKNVNNRSRQWKGKRLSSTNAAPHADRKDEIYELIDNINRNEAEMARLMDELDLLDDYHGALNYDGPDPEDVFTPLVGHRNQEALEAKVQSARQQFGDYVPEGYLSDIELQLYTRLYGEPIAKEEEALDVEEDDDGQEPDRLYREDGEGGWEEVEHEVVDEEDDIPVAYDMEAPAEETATMRRAREVAEELGGELMLERSRAEADTQPSIRNHPWTLEARFGRSAISLPYNTVSGPISAILSNYSNKHIYESAHELFGGRKLPHSTTTLPPKAQMPQLPIPLRAGQRFMTEMEANSFLAVLFPGMYASALSILAEVRKRLGTKWIRDLITKEGGPHVLDVGGGGAGVLAWRDIIRAEWAAMNPEHPKSAPVPVGKSTVLTGSDALQARASIILEDTTFLPRLPNYVHVRDRPTLDDDTEPQPRKHYDIIIAPHNLLGISEDFMRKEHVENLWSLLNPNGGVLVLFEKGRQKGFEAVAGARDMILNRYISSSGATNYETLTESQIESRYMEKETGMIVAPCTNHEVCPMYRIPGEVKGRRDYCHFKQKYYRPDFLQRITGAKDRNDEDVQFSYIAVQRGVDLREKEGIVQGPVATDVAFAGYEHFNPEASQSEVQEPNTSEPASAAAGKVKTFHTLQLPRAIYPPMKRKGHVILDLCTPAGQIERWTVPRSFSKQAFKDARKSQWGDLWALGAKTRLARNIKIGSKDGEGKKERLARRAAAKAAMNEEGGDIDEQNEIDRLDKADLDDALNPGREKEKGQTVPRWKKKAGKRRARQAVKDDAERRVSGLTEQL
ncbi:37S ribosomal protein RSM22 [Aspergillus sclerotialis]|uniref:37S ribosomal protein RSM22 n=1 Tax=Aspergillus sclerotialis TaxID=2070753 RepID=A0A3A2ZBZ7_9EURO|nr:37S ribosomal protein RSM22 [Aspergillus sclerotialis]